MRLSGIKRWGLYLGVAFLVVVVGSSCSGASGGKRIWIDDPLDGERLPVDTVVIHSTSSSLSGAAEITLYVDGVAVVTDKPGGSGDLISHSQPWDPPGPGSYQLQVGLATGDGDSLRSRKITLHIGEVTPTVTPTSHASPTPEITNTIPPSLTPTLPSTPTLTPVPEVSIHFNADRYTIQAGECTTLRWRVEYADRVRLNGASTAVENAREVCPEETKAYQLVAANAAGEKTARVQIQVQAAPEPPAAPQNVRISDRVCSSQDYTVTVVWNDAADNEVGYRVYRDQERIAEVDAGGESYQDAPPGSGPFTYAVEAYNEHGDSQRVTVEEEGCLY